MFVGHGGSLVDSSPFVQTVMGSNPALATTQAPWASPLLAVVCGASAYPCCWVVDLKRRYRNSLNEWTKRISIAFLPSPGLRLAHPINSSVGVICSCLESCCFMTLSEMKMLNRKGITLIFCASFGRLQKVNHIEMSSKGLQLTWKSITKKVQKSQKLSFLTQNILFALLILHDH